MQIRQAGPADAEEACTVVRRSIVELCEADHQGDAATLAAWLANKTPDNMRRWIADNHVFVAVENDRILAVCALKPSGELTLNYVSPDARFRGASKALLRQAEQTAAGLGVAAITLESSVTALRFYQAAGYRSAGTPTRGFGITLGHPLAKTL